MHTWSGVSVVAAVVERDLSSLPYNNLTVHQGVAASLSIQTQQVLLRDGRHLSYDKLCICTGAIPKAVSHNPHVVVLRDQDTIEALAKRLPGVRRVILVGNGGIALEVAHTLTGIEVVWAVKHTHIGDAFFDLDAAAFLCTHLPQASSPPSSQAQSSAAQHSAAEAPLAQGSPAGLPTPQTKSAVQQRDVDHPLHDIASAEAKTCQESQSHILQQPNHAAATVGPSTTATDPIPQTSAAQDSPTQDLPAAQALPATDLPMVGTVVEQVDSAAPNSHGCSTSVQDSTVSAQHQLPQRSRHQRRGKHRHTGTQGVPSLVCSCDQPNLCHAGTKPEPVIDAQQGRVSFGHAVGPQWALKLAQSPGSSHITLEYGVEVITISSNSPHQHHAGQNPQHQAAVPEQPTIDNCGGPSNTWHFDGEDRRWPVSVYLSNGKSYGADLVISAIGVQPNTAWLPQEIKRDAIDGGVTVDRLMQSSVPGVYAAGDACTIAWTDKSPQWFQMRLWTQARTQGMFAAHAMAGVTDEMAFGFNFELFTHVTRFCGMKVVLLGLYNGQGLQGEPAEHMVSYSRTTEGVNPTFIRVLLLRGRMQVDSPAHPTMQMCLVTVQ
ncbi:hypothetical protein ABBQ32_001576 [Trebouxia sp. C0010 RCD-2024]